MNNKKEKHVCAQTENDNPDATVQLLLDDATVSELEREYTLIRQAEDIAAARARGVRFGRPIKKPPENLATLVKQWESGNLTIFELLEQTGLKQATFYRRLREHRLMKRKKCTIKMFTF